MQFVQIGFLSALAALVIPIIIHLLFKRRSRRVELGTIRFLKHVLEQNKRRRRLKRWLLMGLRMAAIGLLVCLFARPFLPKKAKVRAGKMVVVIVDRSATMQLEGENGRLVDQAAEQANDVLGAAVNSTVHAAWFDHKVTPLSTDASSDLRFETGIDCHGGTSYGPAIAWARDLLAASDHEERELHIFTDLQQSGLDWTEMEPMPDSVDVKISDLGRSVVNNISIVGTTTTETLIRPGLPFEMTCVVSNEAVFPIEQQTVVLTLKQGERTITDRKTVKLLPGDLLNIDFKFDQLRPGLWQGQVELLDVTDDLPFDNKRNVAVMVDDQLPVLIVDGRPHPSAMLSASFFLEAAVRLADRREKSFNGSPYLPTVVNQIPTLDPNKYPITILAHVAELSREDVRSVSSYVESGGNLLVFTDEDTNLDSWNVLYEEKVLPANLVETQTTYDLPWRFSDWDITHTVMHLFDDPQHGDPRRLAFRGITNVKPAENANVIASFRGDKPAIVERSFGSGRSLLFTSTCDRQWSEWPRSRLYVPMIHQMLGFLSGLAEGGPIREELIGDWDQTKEQSNNDSPDKTAQQQPGIYKHDRFWKVVNHSPRESEMDRSTVENFSQRFGLKTESEAEVKKQARVQAAGVDIKQNEIWPFFLIALLAVLGLETVLANRTLA